MGRKVTGKPSSRPQKEIDWKKADELMIAGCTGTEIASFFGIHPDTFYIRVEKQYGIGFSAYLQQKKEVGDGLIKAKQFSKALGLTESGDNTLLIWLGKTRLKQRDTDDKEVSSNDKTIDFTLTLSKKESEISELRKILNDRNESQTNDVDLQGQPQTEHLVRSCTIG